MKLMCMVSASLFYTTRIEIREFVYVNFLQMSLKPTTALVMTMPTYIRISIMRVMINGQIAFFKNIPKEIINDETLVAIRQEDSKVTRIQVAAAFHPDRKSTLQKLNSFKILHLPLLPSHLPPQLQKMLLTPN